MASSTDVTGAHGVAISASVASADPSLARSQARAILAERRFHVTPIPRPLHGVLHAIGKALESPLSGLKELVSSLAVGVPGGTSTVWAALAAVVLVASGLLATRRARRALGDPAISRSEAAAGMPLRAGDLQRAAATAEREGNHAEAVRLRFRAGLLLLGASERVAFVPSMSNAQVSQALRSARFDELARRFEKIAYGGQPADEEDAQVARREWARLLGSASSG
jgi:hypothetical protein